MIESIEILNCIFKLITRFLLTSTSADFLIHIMYCFLHFKNYLCSLASQRVALWLPFQVFWTFLGFSLNWDKFLGNAPLMVSCFLYFSCFWDSWCLHIWCNYCCFTFLEVTFTGKYMCVLIFAYICTQWVDALVWF